MRPPLVLDLCAGTGGATHACRVRGWTVITVDNDPQHASDVISDVRQWSWQGERPLAIWASPPCQEFSRHSMPWLRRKNPPPPDMTIFEGCLRIIAETKPMYWILENVRGAVPFFRPILGHPRVRLGPFVLWGNFPLPERATPEIKKESRSGKDRIARAAIPPNISEAVWSVIEADAWLFGHLQKVDSALRA